MTERKLVASSTVRRTGWRRRLPTALVALASVAAVGAALTAAATPVPGLDFLPSGHWVYNAVAKRAVHIDGGSPGVDASVDVKADPGAQVVQGPGTGYVVDGHRISVFGTSTLSVEQEITPPPDESPLAVDAIGGPYLFYRDSGKIVRLGERPTNILTHGKFTDPVVTSDGTVWLFKPEAGTICTLARDAETVGSCPAEVQRGHLGALTVVRDRPEFLDTTADALYPVSDKGLGAGQGIGDGVSDNARLASSDVDGRVAIVDPDKHQMRLINAAEPGLDPVTVPLAPGDYSAPSSTGSAVALVDQDSGKVSTYDGHGTPRGQHVLPKSDGTPRVSKGEDSRIYVEAGNGTRVVVVDRDGTVTDVPAVISPDAGPDAGKAKPKPKPEGVPVPGSTPPEHDERTTTTPPSPPQPRTPPSGQDRQETPDRPVTPKPPVVPASPPGAPTNVSASAGNASATVTWGVASSNKSPITQYRVSWTGGSSGSTTVSASARSAKVTGLTNGESYTISVAAVNSAGRGPAASANAVIPAAAAKAPTGVRLVVNNDTLDSTLIWSRPDLAGGTLQHYLVSGTGYANQTMTGASAPFPGVVPGKSYTFTIRAVTRTTDGRTLTGATATKSVTIPGGPTPKLTVSRGVEDCPGYPDEEDCAQMHVQLTGFEPNTRYEIKPHSDDPGYGNPGSGQTTDENGAVSFDAFEYFGTDHLVWVTVDTPSGTVQSTKIRWE